jgi:hypothetical protein
MRRAGGGDASQLRELLIADDDEFRARWRKPRGWEQPGVNRELPMLDWGIDLRAGRSVVVVSSSRLMCALLHAGLPCQEYCFGGRYFKSEFVLDENDRLIEVDDCG